MKIIENQIHIGIEKPFTFLHVSDTHICRADARNDKRKNRLAKSRAAYFDTAERDYLEILKIAQQEHLMVTHTGDLIDFVSEANLDGARDFTETIDCFMAAGNHEFSLYVGEAKEDAAYRNQSLAHVQESFTNDIRFASRIVNGVNLIAIDNSYYLFEQWQLDRLKEEAEKGLPMLLFMHTPLYSEESYKFATALQEGTPAYLMAVPEEKMDFYTPDRFEQQQADAVTWEADRYIKEHPLIRGIFTGHLHHDFESLLMERVPQFITGIGTIRKITID